MGKILIVGGAGYIGSQVNKELSKRGFETVVFDNLVKGHREFVRWGEYENGSLSNKEDLKKVFEKHKIDLVLNFAAFIEVGESVKDPGKYYSNNVGGAINLMETMRDFGVKNIVFSSTAAVYGEPEYTPIDEKHPKNPVNPYGKSKLFIEEIIGDFAVAHEFKYVIFRYFNACGASSETEIGEWHEPESHLIPLIFQAVMGKRPEIKIFGSDYETPDGTCVRDYIHVEDLAQAHALAVKWLLEGKESLILNLGNGKGFSVREVIEAVREVVKKDFVVTETERRAGDPAVLVAESKKAKEILGWVPKYTSLPEIVKTAWEWEVKKG